MNRTIFLIVLSSFFLFMHCKEKGGDKPGDTKTSKAPEIRYIAPKAGLNMRDKPDTTGALVVTVPFNAKVELNEETGSDITISGATGKWSKIYWQDKTGKGHTGWAFGGFLSAKSVNTRLQSVEELAGDWTRYCEEFGKEIILEWPEYWNPEVPAGDPRGKRRPLIMTIGEEDPNNPNALIIMIEKKYDGGQLYKTERSSYIINKVMKKENGFEFEVTDLNKRDEKTPGNPTISLDYIVKNKKVRMTGMEGMGNCTIFLKK